MKKVFMALSKSILAGFLCFSSVINCQAETADESETSVKGQNYIFKAEKSTYDFIKNGDKSKNISGALSINGNLKKSKDNDGFTSYTVNDSNVSFSYQFNDSIINADSSKKWALSKDKVKTVNGVKTGKIDTGALIVETSVDGKKWTASSIETDIFKDKKSEKSNFYKVNDVQLANGRFYRVYVAYKTEKKSKKKKMAVLSDYQYRKCLEVYDFYLKYNDKLSASTTKPDDEPHKTLGERKEFNSKHSGFKEEVPIESGDPHIGWSIGKFRVNGYTSEMENENGIPVFLKTVGDSVTLWFNLEQDIKKLNGDSQLTISDDKKAQDLVYETREMDFNHGALIIKYKNNDGDTFGPYVYTDFLAANGTEGANTKIVLNEEGTYYVSLDYEIKDTRSKVGPISKTKYRDYSLYTKFEVRNGNNQVFLFDASSGSELMNGDSTENGFRIDLANSNSVNVSVQKFVLNDSTNTLDSRFNKPAQNGDVFKDEGLYEVTFNNSYSDILDKKTIYVGDSSTVKKYKKVHENSQGTDKKSKVVD